MESLYRNDQSYTFNTNASLMIFCSNLDMSTNCYDRYYIAKGTTSSMPGRSWAVPAPLSDSLSPSWYRGDIFHGTSARRFPADARLIPKILLELLELRRTYEL